MSARAAVGEFGPFDPLRAIQMDEQVDELLMAVVHGDDPGSDVIALQEETLLAAGRDRVVSA